MKNIFSLLLLISILGCSADSDIKNDGYSGDPKRKLEPSEVQKLVTLSDISSGFDAADYPIDRIFGEPNDPQNQRPKGEQMFELLKACNKTESKNTAENFRSLSGSDCPINFAENTVQTEKKETLESITDSSYKILKSDYLIEGHITSWTTKLKATLSISAVSASINGGFQSTLYGSGTSSQTYSKTQKRVSETRNDFEMKMTFDTSLVSNSIAFEYRKSGYIEQVTGGQQEEHVLSESCFIDKKQFDCNQAPTPALQHALQVTKMVR